MDGFIGDDGGLFGTIRCEGLGVVGGFEGRAVANATANADSTALIDGRLESCWIPAIHEITVEAMTGGVALGKDEFAAILLDVFHAVEDFEEEVN